MNKVIVKSGPFRVYPGAVIGLTPAQAQPRAHCLRATGDRDIYEVLGIVEFKHGESLLIKTEGMSRREVDGLEMPSASQSSTPVNVKKLAKAAS